MIRYVENVELPRDSPMQRKNRQKKYVTALVQPFLSSVFLEQGFKKVDIYITPLGILLRYLLRKSLFDILNFSRKSESALYIKI